MTTSLASSVKHLLQRKKSIWSSSVSPTYSQGFFDDGKTHIQVSMDDVRYLSSKCMYLYTLPRDPTDRLSINMKEIHHIKEFLSNN